MLNIAILEFWHIHSLFIDFQEYTKEFRVYSGSTQVKK